LTLRIDNADLRLTPIGRAMGLVGDRQWEQFDARRARLERNRERAATTQVRIGDSRLTAAAALGRPIVTLADLAVAGFEIDRDARRGDLDEATLEAECKYRGYLSRHASQLARTLADEGRAIPAGFEYRDIPGLSREVVERLSAIRPATIGQAGRVPGVTPAAVAIVAARVVRTARH
jgi:tRNA uridine 5-carboxymethylaminomethyl modification enzyme